MKLNSVDLNKIATFCQVINSGNFRLASEVLNVTPSALSQTISSLEYSLGFPLFDRVGKKLVPTQKGLRLHQDFQKYHAGFVQSLQKLAEPQDQVTGLLRIGSYLEFAKSQLSDVLKEFLARFPQAQVKLSFENPTRLQQMLETNKIDLCFSIYPSLETRTILSKKVYQNELVLIAPKTMSFKTWTYEQIMELPVVEYYFNHQPVRRWISLHFKKRPKKLQIRSYASTAEMVFSLVQAGVGIGVVPQYLLSKDDLASVQIIRPTNRKLMDHIWMLERKSGARSTVHSAFTQQVAQRFET